MKSILREWYGAKTLEESGNNGEKHYFMEGVFVQADIKNQNGRVYPVREISEAVEDVQNRLSNNYSILGELDHPESLNINLDRVSHVIEKMWMEDNCGMGRLRLLSTPMGELAKTLLKVGVETGKKIFGVSSRGSGEVDYNGKVSDFDIITVDIVAQPSAPDAYPKPIYESLYGRNGYIIEDLAKTVHATHDESAQKYLEKELLQFIRTLG